MPLINDISSGTSDSKWVSVRQAKTLGGTQVGDILYTLNPPDDFRFVPCMNQNMDSIVYPFLKNPEYRGSFGAPLRLANVSLNYMEATTFEDYALARHFTAPQEGSYVIDCYVIVNLNTGGNAWASDSNTQKNYMFAYADAPRKRFIVFGNTVVNGYYQITELKKNSNGSFTQTVLRNWQPNTYGNIVDYYAIGDKLYMLTQQHASKQTTYYIMTFDLLTNSLNAQSMLSGTDITLYAQSMGTVLDGVVHAPYNSRFLYSDGNEIYTIFYYGGTWQLFTIMQNGAIVSTALTGNFAGGYSYAKNFFIYDGYIYIFATDRSDYHLYTSHAQLRRYSIANQTSQIMITFNLPITKSGVSQYDMLVYDNKIYSSFFGFEFDLVQNKLVQFDAFSPVMADQTLLTGNFRVVLNQYYVIFIHDGNPYLVRYVERETYSPDFRCLYVENPTGRLLANGIFVYDYTARKSYFMNDRISGYHTEIEQNNSMYQYTGQQLTNFVYAKDIGKLVYVMGDTTYGGRFSSRLFNFDLNMKQLPYNPNAYLKIQEE